MGGSEGEEVGCRDALNLKAKRKVYTIAFILELLWSVQRFDGRSQINLTLLKFPHKKKLVSLQKNPVSKFSKGLSPKRKFKELVITSSFSV